MIESTADAWLAAHLTAYTGDTWRTPLDQGDDIGNSYFFVSAHQGGSDETFAPASISNTGQPERGVFAMTFELGISTTFHNISTRKKQNSQNIHQQLIGMARAAMLHGSLSAAVQCDEIEIIGWLTQAATQSRVNENQDLVTLLTYTCNVGFKDGAWPAQS